MELKPNYYIRPLFSGNNNRGFSNLQIYNEGLVKFSLPQFVQNWLAAGGWIW